MKSLPELVTLHNALFENAESVDFDFEEILALFEQQDVDISTVVAKILVLKISQQNQQSLSVVAGRKHFAKYLKANAEVLRKPLTSLEFANILTRAMTLLDITNKESLFLDLFSKASVMRLLKAPGVDYAVDVLQLMSTLRVKSLINSSLDFIEIFNHFGYNAASVKQQQDSGAKELTEKNLKTLKKNAFIEAIYLNVLKSIKVKKIVNFIFAPKIVEKLYKNGRRELLSLLFCNHIDAPTCKLAFRLMSVALDSELIFTLMLNNDYFVQNFYQTSQESLFYAVLKIVQEIGKKIKSAPDSPTWSTFQLRSWIPKQFNRQFLSKAVLSSDTMVDCIPSLIAVLSVLVEDLQSVSSSENYQKDVAFILGVVPSCSTIISLFQNFHNNVGIDYILLRCFELYVSLLKGSVDFDAFKFFVPKLAQFDASCQLLICNILATLNTKCVDWAKPLITFSSSLDPDSEMSPVLARVICRILAANVLFEGNFDMATTVFSYLVEHADQLDAFFDTLKVFGNPYELYKIPNLTPGNVLRLCLETRPEFAELFAVLAAPESSPAVVEAAPSATIMDWTVSDMKSAIVTMKRSLLVPAALKSVSLFLSQAEAPTRVMLTKLITNHSKFTELLTANLSGFMNLLVSVMTSASDCSSFVSSVLVKAVIDAWLKQSTCWMENMDIFLCLCEQKFGYSILKFVEVVEVLQSIDPAVMLETCVRFDTHRLYLPDISQPADITKPSLYSPRFYLSLVAHLLMSHQITLQRLIDTGLLGLVVRCLSSNDEAYRRCAYRILDLVIDRFPSPFEQESYSEQQAEVLAEMNLKREYYHLLHSIRTAIVETETDSTIMISSFVALFVVHAFRVLAEPLDPLFLLFNRFLLARPFIDVSDIPLLYECLYPSSKLLQKSLTVGSTTAVHDEGQSVNAYRNFILTILKQVGNVLDIQLLYKRKVLELLQTATGVELQDVVEIFEAYVKESSRHGTTSVLAMSQFVVYLCSKANSEANALELAPFLADYQTMFPEKDPEMVASFGKLTSLQLQ